MHLVLHWYELQVFTVRAPKYFNPGHMGQKSWEHIPEAGSAQLCSLVLFHNNYVLDIDQVQHSWSHPAQLGNKPLRRVKPFRPVLHSPRKIPTSHAPPHPAPIHTLLGKRHSCETVSYVLLHWQSPLYSQIPLNSLSGVFSQVASYSYRHYSSLYTDVLVFEVAKLIIFKLLHSGWNVILIRIRRLTVCTSQSKFQFSFIRNIINPKES